MAITQAAGGGTAQVAWAPYIVGAQLVTGALHVLAGRCSGHLGTDQLSYRSLALHYCSKEISPDRG